MTAWPFGDLLPFQYQMIVADPPWSFKLYSEAGEAKSAQAQYDCMPLADIKKLPVSQLAGGDCLLWLWATAPMLRESLEVMEAWHFRYVTMGCWHKKTPGGKTAFGTGYRLRSACEPFLIGVIGNPATTRDQRNLVEGVAREHSRKPEEAYTMAERWLPNARRLELFSRQTRKGWDTWGNETEKFNPPTAASAAPSLVNAASS